MDATLRLAGIGHQNLVNTATQGYRKPLTVVSVAIAHILVFGALVHYAPKVASHPKTLSIIATITLPLNPALTSEPPRPLPTKPQSVETQQQPKRILEKTPDAPPTTVVPSETPSANPLESRVDTGVSGIASRVPASATASESASAAPAASAPAQIEPPRFDADYLANPAPQYPALSRRMGEAGRVWLRVYVNADGSAGEVTVKTSSGFSRLDAAALEAVKRWKFIAAKRGATAIAEWVLVPINFSLDR
jgi:periplasmic protein TonB